MIRLALSTVRPSHPTGVRGLKYRVEQISRGISQSHPTGVRGLKYPRVASHHSTETSHPTGVRGLKFGRDAQREISAEVAPHWGAWIEISRPC